MEKNFVALLVILMLLLEIVSGVVSNVVSAIFKWSWPQKSNSKTDSRPKLVAGSSEGYTGHMDGKPTEARMNHPKGLTVDDRGNKYVTDTINMAIRKISDDGVVTIAGGNLARGGRFDGLSEDAEFSNDLNVVYMGSSCSLLVIDRGGNRAILEIQLHEDDCSYQYDGNLHLAGFFGYMMPLLQRRIGAMLSSDNDPKAYAGGTPPHCINQRCLHYFQNETNTESKKKAYLVHSRGFFSMPAQFIFALFGGLFFGFKRRPPPFHHHMKRHYHRNWGDNWPVQESFTIPHEEEPPPMETRDSIHRNSYPFTTKDMDKIRPFRQNLSFNSGWKDGLHEQQQQQQHHQKHRASNPQSCY